MDKINLFFKAQNVNTSKNNLTFTAPHENLKYERMYAEYYSALFNVFKGKIPLELPDNQHIGKSSWEPLLKAGHHGFVLTLKNFLPLFNTKSEMGILMGCFDVLKFHGMGIFDLGLAPKGAFMKISVSHALEDASFEMMAEIPENPLCAFTAGMVLACFNLSMTLIDVSTIESDSLDILEKMYNESPDIVQVEYGSITREESEFTLHARQI